MRHPEDPSRRPTEVAPLPPVLRRRDRPGPRDASLAKKLEEDLAAWLRERRPSR